MPRQNEFVRYITDDLLADIPGIHSWAMFGGWGIYQEKTMFGIVIDNRIYFKVGEKDIPTYKAAGSTPSTYERKDGKRIAMSYWKIPEDVLEDREKIIQWAQKAISESRKSRKQP